MSEENKTVELKDEELNHVTGGAKTGDIKGNKVYIQFPLFLASMSGYYGCDEIENLVNQYIGYKELIKNYITPEMIKAVKDLYDINNRAIPTTVSEFFS